MSDRPSERPPNRTTDRLLAQRFAHATPLIVSSTTTSSIQARTPVGILKTTSVSMPTIRPLSEGRARSAPYGLSLDDLPDEVRGRDGGTPRKLRDQTVKGATSSSSTLLATATSIPLAEVDAIAVKSAHEPSCNSLHSDYDTNREC